MATEEKSLIWIVGTLVVFVAVFGWGFLAGSYAGAHATPVSEMTDAERNELQADSGMRSRRSGAVSAFISHSIEQLPNFGGVISWHLSNRIWLPILILLAEIGVIGGGVVLKKVEASLSAPRHQRHR